MQLQIRQPKSQSELWSTLGQLRLSALEVLRSDTVSEGISVEWMLDQAQPGKAWAA